MNESLLGYYIMKSRRSRATFQKHLLNVGIFYEIRLRNVAEGCSLP
jgi:hypothetical protein